MDWAVPAFLYLLIILFTFCIVHHLMHRKRIDKIAKRVLKKKRKKKKEVIT